MAKQRLSTTKNATLLKLKGTPFKKASDLKAEEEQILKEEWANVERARVRRELLMKDANQKVIAPFLNGFKAKFVGAHAAEESLIRVYLTKDDAVQVDIDDQLKSEDTNGAMESLVKSLTESFMNGYLTALGLKDENLFKATKKPSRKD